MFEISLGEKMIVQFRRFYLLPGLRLIMNIAEILLMT